MARLIDADELLKVVAETKKGLLAHYDFGSQKTHLYAAFSTIEEMVNDAPTVDPRLFPPQVKVETNLYDKETIFPDCTVQVLENTVTGETSVGWWENEAEEVE